MSYKSYLYTQTHCAYTKTFPKKIHPTCGFSGVLTGDGQTRPVRLVRVGVAASSSHPTAQAFHIDALADALVTGGVGGGVAVGGSRVGGGRAGGGGGLDRLVQQRHETLCEYVGDGGVLYGVLLWGLIG